MSMNETLAQSKIDLLYVLNIEYAKGVEQEGLLRRYQLHTQGPEYVRQLLEEINYD
jgi:hypothetical protein